MEQENERKGIVVDRYSIIAITILIAIILLFILKGKNRVYGFGLGTTGMIAGLITVLQPGRISRNDYDGEIYYKGENDCGATLTPKKDIDGVFIKGKYYKTADGTDIVIDKEGNVKPAGFGTAIINRLDGGGYLNEAPDECWLIEE